MIVAQTFSCLLVVKKGWSPEKANGEKTLSLSISISLSIAISFASFTLYNYHDPTLWDEMRSHISHARYTYTLATTNGRTWSGQLAGNVALIYWTAAVTNYVTATAAISTPPSIFYSLRWMNEYHFLRWKCNKCLSSHHITVSR